MRPIVFLFTVCLGLSGWARAEDAPPQVDTLPEIAAIHVGFDGHYKVGLWTPVEVVLRGGSRGVAGQVSVIVPDGDGVPSRVASPESEPCQAPADGEARVLLYVRFGRIDSTATVRLQTDGGQVIERVFSSSSKEGQGDYRSALPTDRKLVLCFASSEFGAEEAAQWVDSEPTRQPVIARLDDLARMPTRWCGYEGVDAVIIATSDPTVWDGRVAQGGPHVAALEHWVRMGGRLVLMAGSRAEAVADPACPLSSFLPGSWTSILELRQIGSLESYVSGTHAVPVADGAGRRRISAARFETHDGVEVWEADLPVVVRTVRGFGQQIFLAVDLDCPPLSQWNDRGALVARLLGWPKRLEKTTAEGTVMTHLGFSDISSQLRSALDRFTGVSLIPFGVVVAVLVVYLALIGPADYWFLARWKRLGWTWITFPILIVLFSGGAYWAAYGLKGTKVQLNQVDLIDVDVRTGLVRGTHWSNLYSPRGDTYDLSLQPQLPQATLSDTRVNLAWLGLPGSGLGGMDTKAVSPWRRDYRFSPALDRMEGLPLQTWSTRSLTGRWSATWEGRPSFELTHRDDLAGGRLTNPFDFTLDRCLLIYDRWVYDLGKLKPGATVRVDGSAWITGRPEEIRPATLKTLLTGHRQVFDEQTDKLQDRATRYEVTSADVAYIVRTMMFYDLAGGRNYVHLSNQYQPFVDLTSLLSPDRAMLIGMVGDEQPPAAELCRDGQPLDDKGSRHFSVYRFVFPVMQPETGTPSGK